MGRTDKAETIHEEMDGGNDNSGAKSPEKPSIAAVKRSNDQRYAHLKFEPRLGRAFSSP